MPSKPNQASSSAKKSTLPAPPMERLSKFPKIAGRGLGHLPSAVDVRDYRVGSLLGGLRGLSNENVQLVELVSRVRDQGSTNSCTGHAVTAAAETRLKRMGINYTGAPLAAYTLGRMLEPSRDIEAPLYDEGAYPRYVMKAISEWGLPKDWEWPMTQDALNRELPLDVLQGASRHKLNAYYRVDGIGSGRTHQMMQAIEQGYPIVFALKVDREFLDLTPKDSLVEQLSGNRVGGHMMTCLGYSTLKTGKRVFRVLNSWGTGWADGGFCWMHEHVFQDGSASDFFALQIA